MTRLGFVYFFALASVPVMAQREWPLFTADVGGGFTAPVYQAANQLNYGWNIDAGAGVRVIPYLGVKIDFAYNEFDLNQVTANSFGFPRGQERIFSFSLDPIIHLNPKGPVDFYLVGGGGVYHQSMDFNGTFVNGFGTFFGDLGSQTVVKPGVNGGAGFQFGVRHSMKFYAEARYHNIFTSGRDTAFVPVTFGIRF